MNFATVKTLFRAELRMVARDRRMIVTSILLPLVVTPLLFLGSSLGIKKHEKKLAEMVYPCAVSGPRAAMVKDLLAATRKRLDAAAATNKTVFRFKEVVCADPVQSLNQGDIQLILEGLPASSDDASHTNSAIHSGPSTAKPSEKDNSDDVEKPVPGSPVVRIVFRGDRHESAAGLSKMREALSQTRRLERAELLKTAGFPLPTENVVAVTEANLASQTQISGLALGKSLTLLLLLFIFSSGAVVATDSLAGEKERGTLETLLTTAAGRLEILAAKHLVIVVVALLITAIQILNLLAYIHFKLIPVPANWAAAITPFTAALLFFLYVPLAALAANVLLLVSGYARGYKEAQMWFLPVLLVGLVPALAPWLPGVPLRSAAVLVPIANLALAAKEILTGSFDWPMIALAWLVTAGAAAWTARLGARSLVQERLVTAADTDAVDFAGGPALFERRVLLWFCVIWAVLLIVSNYTSALDLRFQLVINLVGIFFGAACLMIRIYRLDPKLALALRFPRPAVWLGLVLAVPGGMLSALGLFRLANLLLPAPTRTVESFTDALLPPNVPFIQILLFMTVLPGIFEEITFRGLLLHGLRRRLHPVPLSLVVGIIFGIFHVALFRLVPTAALGAMFAGVTLLTGSIFPAMVWHAASNALGLLASKFNLPENELDSVCYLAGAGLLAAAFWIFWRHRTPYPDLRRPPPSR
ncbi:MAG TPA: CPBP family glutamic-type intramembrane protease [Verrucomicrobiae bacterium]